MAKNYHRKNGTQLPELLQTSDPKEQVKRVQNLIQLVQTPVVDLIIRADPRIQQVTVVIIGANINFESAYAILDQAREWLRQRELAEVAKPGQIQANTEQEPAPEPVEIPVEPG